MNDATLREVERVASEYPDGIHTCAELQQLEPGRRSCTCGRCDTAPKNYKGVPVPETFKNHPNRWDNDFDMLESLPGHWWRKGVDDHIEAMLLGREGNHPVTGIAYND